MPYSTPAMLRQALVPTSDGTVPSPLSRTAADLSDDQLADAIEEADSTIDAYIGGYYAVPVALDGNAEVPHPIDYWSRNIAAYNATLSYRGSADFADQDPVARRYTATMAALTLVQGGKAKLQLPENFSGDAGAGAGKAINPTYTGDLFDANDFNLRPISSDWPFSGWGGGYNRGFGW